MVHFCPDDDAHQQLSLLKDSERNSRKQMMMTQTTKTRVINTKVIRTNVSKQNQEKDLMFHEDFSSFQRGNNL